MKSFKVNVSAEVIKKSKRKTSRLCMVAEALHKRGLDNVVVTSDTIRFTEDETRYIFPCPAVASAKIMEFDQGKEIQPFKFNLSANTGFSSPKRKVAKGWKRKKGKVTRIVTKKRVAVKEYRRHNGIRTIRYVEEGDRNGD